MALRRCSRGGVSQEEMGVIIHSNTWHVVDKTVYHINNIWLGIPGQRVTVKDSLEGPQFNNHEDPMIPWIVDATDKGLAVSFTNIKGQYKSFHHP